MIRIKQTSRDLSREDGFTLPELLMAATLLIGLLAVMGAMIMVITRAQPRISERSAQVQEGRAMIERVTREVREGSDLVATPTPSPTALSFNTFVRKQVCGGSEPPTSSATPSIECRVSYTCTAGTCRRSEAAADAAPFSGTPVVVVNGLNSSQVFSYWPTSVPRHVAVTLEYPAEAGGESVTLSDGAALRNVAG